MPGPGGTAQLVTDTSSAPATSRVIGLRLGLGRGVAVAVVAAYGGVVRVIGAQPVLRAAFVDGALGPATAADPNGPPADQNATTQWAPVDAGPGTVLRGCRGRRQRQPVGPVGDVHRTATRPRLTA